MNRRDIKGWFPRRNEEVLAGLVERYNVRTVIEIGTFLGASAAFFAERCVQVTCIDPFVIWDDYRADDQRLEGLQPNFFTQFWDNMQTLSLENKVTPVILKSQEAAAALPWLHADLVYIDAAHDYDSVHQDIRTWIDRADTIICGDDYSPHWPGVEKAVLELLPEARVEGDSLWYKTLTK